MRWCVDYIFLSSIWHLNEIQIVANAYLSNVISCHNLHYQNNMCCQFSMEWCGTEGGRWWPHFRHMYEFMYHWTATISVNKSTWCSTYSTIWPFKMLCIQHCSSTFLKCRFENWKTFRWLNKRARNQHISIPFWDTLYEIDHQSNE